MIQQFADETKQLLQDEMMAEYLFGSYATNTQTAVSDIDILIIVKALQTRIATTGQWTGFRLFT